MVNFFYLGISTYLVLYFLDWFLKLGPVVDNQYDYMIVAVKLKHLEFVRTRNITRFNERYNGEVRKWLNEHASSTRREKHPDGCQYYVPEGFFTQ